MPVYYNVELNTGGGSINGKVEADTSGGRIIVSVVTGGDVNMETSGGSIDIEKVDGDVLADTSGESIDIGEVTGEVSGDT